MSKELNNEREELKKEFEGISLDNWLEEIGIERRIAIRLYSKGIYTVEQLLNTSKEEIKEIHGFKNGGEKYEMLIKTKEKLEKITDYLTENQEQKDLENERWKKSEEKPLTLNDGIEFLDLSVRAYNLIKRAGIHRTEELFSKSEEELSQIKGLGPKVIEEIRQKKEETSKESSLMESIIELAEKSKAMKQQEKEAKELLDSYEKLSSGKNATEPDFKDE